MSVRSHAVVRNDETSRRSSTVNNCVICVVGENGFCSQRAQPKHENSGNLEPNLGAISARFGVLITTQVQTRMYEVRRTSARRGHHLSPEGVRSCKRKAYVGFCNSVLSAV
jgi:hypothetical protein